MKYAIAHLADIHYCKGESEGALIVLNALVKDLKKQKESLADYEFYLAITGDIVFAGQYWDSYLSFKHEFDDKLNEIGLTKQRRMMVPGNHDIDRLIISEDLDIYKERIEKYVQSEREFNNFVNDKNYRDDKFDNYHLFESEFAELGIDYSSYGKGWILNNNLGVYCLNTSLSSFGGLNGVDDKKRLAIFTRAITDWCTNSGTSTNILLMHHPLSHLIQWGKETLRQLIENHFTLCLCGHNHEQDVFFNTISNKSLICSAPQVFTGKNDLLGYAIILIESNNIDKVIYREYSKGQFFNGHRFSGNDEGVVSIQNNYLKCIEVLQDNLTNALSFFKGQPVVFVKPKISKQREFDDEPSLLDQIIKEPSSAIIVSHPQFGLTCLSHYMRLEAYKKMSSF